MWDERDRIMEWNVRAYSSDLTVENMVLFVLNLNTPLLPSFKLPVYIN